MRKIILKPYGILNRNETVEGKSIEQQIAERMDGGNIELGGKALLYTEKKDGVLPETNIRTDRFEVAMMALDAVERARVAKRDATGKESQNESTQGTTAGSELPEA